MQKCGFTLIELLIVLIIISILAGIIYPQYSAHVVKVRRNLAVVFMGDLAGRLEQYYATNNKYSGATLESFGFDAAALQKYYNFSLQAGADAFLLRADPINSQAKNDSACGALILDSLGNQSISGGGSAQDCWR